MTSAETGRSGFSHVLYVLSYFSILPFLRPCAAGDCEEKEGGKKKKGGRRKKKKAILTTFTIVYCSSHSHVAHFILRGRSSLGWGKEKKGKGEKKKKKGGKKNSNSFSHYSYSSTSNLTNNPRDIGKCQRREKGKRRGEKKKEKDCFLLEAHRLHHGRFHVCSFSKGKG